MYDRAVEPLHPSEREQISIATAKGRNGPKSPYTQLRATKKKYVPYLGYIHTNGCTDSWIRKMKH